MREYVTAWYLHYNHEIFSTLFVVIAALSVITVIDVFTRRLLTPLTPNKRAKTVLELIHNALKVAIFIIAIVISLSIFHINVTPILASAGILGLAIGFGSQVLVKDVISGIFFIFENQFNTGDMVQVDTVQGVVEQVGLRTTSIRDIDTGALHILPNGSITKLANLSDRWSNAAIPITVSIKNDPDKVIASLESVASKLAADSEYSQYIIEPHRIHTLDDLSTTSMIFTVIFKCHPGKQHRIARQYRYLVKKEFDKAKIAFA